MARERLSTVRNDKVSQDLFSVYAQQLVNFGDRWGGYVSLRGDMLRYQVDGREPVYGRSTAAAAATRSPARRLGWPSPSRRRTSHI